jgi:MSHA biogenesis protein MshP
MTLPRRRTTPCTNRPAVRGLGSITIIVLLVGMAALAAAVMRLGQQGATTTQQDTQALRASAAARSGIEWGLYQALKGSWTSCASQSQTLDLSSDGGMRVAVTCTSTAYYEGESAPGTPATVRLYTIDAIACNSTSCPDAAAAVRQGYVERRRQVLAVN